jgi:hypothetical protein
MRQHVIKLYCEVFELLCHALTWFTSKRKRIGAAFKKNFYDDTVVNLLNRIEKTVTAIDREANYISHGQVREIYERVLDAKLEDRLRSVGIQNRRDGEAAVEGKLGMAREAIAYPDVTMPQLEEEEAVSQTTLVEEMCSSDELMTSESEDSTVESVESEDGQLFHIASEMPSETNILQNQSIVRDTRLSGLHLILALIAKSTVRYRLLHKGMRSCFFQRRFYSESNDG